MDCPSHGSSTALAPWFAALALMLAANPAARCEPVLETAALANSARYIVLAVANEPRTGTARVGGTVRTYGGGNDYVVSDNARRTLRTVATQFGLQSVAAWPIALLHLQCAVFAIPEGATRDELLTRLQKDPRIALAEPLNSYAVQTAGEDPYADVQAGNERMSIGAAHHLATGHGIRIALIDTGLDANHPDLRGRIEAQRNFVDADRAQFQRDRHGTAVAGVLAANRGNGQGIVGVAPEALLLALKACWQLQPGRDEARCNSFTLAQALASAIELKAQIINLSLSGPPDPLLTALAEQAIRRGIVLVGPGSATPSFPGSLAQVLSVARSEDHDIAAHMLQAPGRDVLTLAPGGEYGFSSGSSISTAEITGVTALLLSRDPHLDTARIHRLLDEASDSRDTSAGPNRSVNACHAIAQLVVGADCGAFTVKAH